MIWDWATLDHMVAVASFAGLALLLLLRSDLRKYFASKEDVSRLESRLGEQGDLLDDHRAALLREREEAAERLTRFEERQRHGLLALEQRQVATEVSMAGLKATLDGVVAGLASVQRGVDMLIRHQIERERT